MYIFKIQMFWYLVLFIFKQVEVLLILYSIDYDLWTIFGPQKGRYKVNEDFHVKDLFENWNAQ